MIAISEVEGLNGSLFFDYSGASDVLLIVCTIISVICLLVIFRVNVVKSIFDQWIPYIWRRQDEVLASRDGKAMPFEQWRIFCVDNYKRLPSFNALVLNPRYWLKFKMESFCGFKEFNEEIEMMKRRDI